MVRTCAASSTAKQLAAIKIITNLLMPDHLQMVDINFELLNVLAAGVARV